MVRFSQILGEENIEKFIVDNAKEMFASGNNEMLHDAFVEYLMAVANSSNEDDKKKVHDLMEETIKIDPPPSMGGGFTPEVDDWEEENREIYI